MFFRKITSEDQEWLTSDEDFRTPQQIERAYLGLEGEQRKLFEEICHGLPAADEYARAHASKYGWDESVFELARTFVPQQFQHPVPYFERHWHCFESSFIYAEQTGLFYVEGLAINPSGAQIHAWNSTDGTDVLDYTWPHQHVNRYFGIVFDVEKMKKYWPVPGAILAYRKQESKGIDLRLVAR